MTLPVEATTNRPHRSDLYDDYWRDGAVCVRQAFNRDDGAPLDHPRFPVVWSQP